MLFSEETPETLIERRASSPKPSYEKGAILGLSN
jgi:hypothetical protein